MTRKLSTPVVHSEWEKFAKQDPYTYILTSLQNSNLRDFWQSGYRTVRDDLLPLVREWNIPRRTAFELGCGLGRLAFPLAAHFETVVAVDIAAEMVRRARRLATDHGVTNTRFSVISGPEDLQSGNEYAGKVDFLYSWLVFQHIPDLATIAGYLGAIGLLLNQGGIACLQFDTRPASPGYHLKTALPDFLLPRFWRRGIRRIRRSPGAIEEHLRASGLRVIEEFARSTELHRYVVCKAPRESAQR